MTRKVASTSLLSGVLVNVGLFALNLLAPPAFAESPDSLLACPPPYEWRECEVKCPDKTEGCCGEVCAEACQGCKVNPGG